jgi:NitT/TauT family transport system permease protein
MQSRTTIPEKKWLFSMLALVSAITIWYLIAAFKVFPEYTLPSPQAVLQCFRQEAADGRLLDNTVASLWRVFAGFTIAAVIGIPLGLVIGRNNKIRASLLPGLNFFRFLSPLAWIPFAILWFQIGDKAAIFLIVLSTVFPLAIATLSAMATIPNIYYRIARDYNYTGYRLFFKMILPAILPQLITGIRVSYGIAWVVIVAAEMVGCQNGLGYGIWDARNGLRLDLAVCYMITIGLVGLAVDRLILLFAKLDKVKWGYES